MPRPVEFIVTLLLTLATLGCASSPLPVSAPTLAPAPTGPPARPSSDLATPATGQALPRPSPTVTSDPTLTKLIAQATADLAQRKGIAATSINVRQARAVEWSDSSLGCPVQGQMYAQVITPGYLIVLVANGQTYEYHA